MAAIKQTAMRLDNETKDVIERIARRLGVSQTAAVEAAVRDFERTLNLREQFTVGMSMLMHDLGHLPHAEVVNISNALQTIANKFAVSVELDVTQPYPSLGNQDAKLNTK